MGTTYIFSKVEVSNPPRITFAIGLWISLPVGSPFSASGIRARAAVNAVISMGNNLSVDPLILFH